MSKKKRETDLDVVRGCAILLAMGWHINRLPVAGLGRFLMMPGAVIGWAGVDLFFVLSGFLIGGLIMNEVRKTGSFNYPRFFLRRVIRLWPILYVFLFAMLLVTPWRSFFWQAALHIQNYARTASATHLWSLAVEEHFYLIFGLGFPLVLLPLGWRRSLPVALLAVIALCPLARTIAVFGGVDPTLIQSQSQYRLDAIAAGLLLAYMAEEAPDLYSHLFARRIVLWAGFAGGVVFLWWVPKDSVLGSSLGYTVSAAASVCFLLGIHRSGIERHLPHLARAMAFLGLISYPLYLWHVPVMKFGEQLLPHLIGADYPGIETLAIYLAAIVVASAMHFAIEKPIGRWRERLTPSPVIAVPDESVLVS